MYFAKSASHMYILIAGLIIIAAILILFAFDSSVDTLEGFNAVPIVWVNKDANQLAYGYYQLDDTQMALIPYGYKVDSTNPKKIIPITNTAEYNLNPEKHDLLPVPKPGEPIPDGFYLLSNTSLAVLPPNMKPMVKSIDFSGNPPKLLIYYDKEYISETQYYNNKYTPKSLPQASSLPDGVYYTDPSHTLISFLKSNQIADVGKGYGAILNPLLNLSTTNFDYATSNYRDVSNNYDVQFHSDADEIKKQYGMYDLEFGEVRVVDQSGNIIILPKTNSQGSVTFYQPDEFPFGASTYVPNYEDSVYLSSIGNRTRFGNTQTNGNTYVNGCDMACQAYNEFKHKMDKYYG